MKKLLPLALLPLLLFACKKDKDPEPTTHTFNPMPLKQGNYWVYNHYKVDTNGVETYLNSDSLYVQGTQVINGNTFYVIKGSNFVLLGTPDSNGNVYMRDSSGFILDNNHTVYYAPNSDTLSVINDPYVSLYTYMAYKDSVWTVPAGAFSKTATLLTTGIYSQPIWHYWSNRRDALMVFVDGLGLIKRRYFYANPPEYYEYRLVRYHVN